MSRTARIQDLRRTVERLPLRTREAMLQGLREERIIVGAYTDKDGGVCPMLAAHRRGGRTDLLRFAQTWDRFTRAPSRGSRVATRRELATLVRLLEASIAAAETAGPEVSLAGAIAEHGTLVRRRGATPARSRAPRISVPGRRRDLRLPAWMRPVATVEELSSLLEEVERQASARMLADTGTDRGRAPDERSLVSIR